MESAPPPDIEIPTIELKDPGLAAVLAYLIPGAGHLYQGRIGKGLLFMICILGTYLWGLALGGKHVVYASWRPEDRHLPYLCQVGVGLPALPALVQTYRVRSGKEPHWGGFMAPPEVTDPMGDRPDELDEVHFERPKGYELATVYTMIAGLLNILAIYDAWGGPVFIIDERKLKKKKKEPAATTDATKPPG